MNLSSPKSRTIGIGALFAAIAVLAIGIYAGRISRSGRERVSPESKTASTAGGTVAEHGHDHGHSGHQESNSLELSAQARSNIGLQVTTVQLQAFEKTITVPGMIVERPGRTTVEVTAPMTGVITRIASIQGEVVQPNQVLAEMRLTHEELVQAQGDLLRTAESLDVTQREIDRIKELTKDGAVAGKTLIDLNYEQQKAAAVLRAQSQTLVLHGLSEAQVATILETRKLLSKLSILAPEVLPGATENKDTPTLQVQDLRVALGQHVTAGDVMFVLADHRELYIEGQAFEQDVQAIGKAAAEDWKVSAIIESKSSRPEDIISGLTVLYLANRVDPESRAFRFYVTLPNRILRDRQTQDGRHFLDWEFKPGQRVQVRVPVDQWKDRIVLPVEAVATEGTESFVFQANGDHFDRRPVHVEYRDQLWAVIANDGAIFPGDVVAKSGAFQLQAALKNKSGGAIDPHAGHSH